MMPSSALGVSQLTLGLAGTAVRLSSTCQEWIHGGRSLWGGFEVDEDPCVDLVFTRDEESGAGCERAADRSIGNLRTSLYGSLFRFDLNQYHATINLDARRGELRGPLSPVPFALLWRYLLPAVANDLLILHACALIDSGRGYLGCGSSGSGKSTLAALLPERALCDELVAVRKTGGFTIHSLPYGSAKPGSARLAALHFLRQASAHARRRLPANAVLPRLAPLVVWPVFSPIAMERTLVLLNELVESVPAFDLGFALCADVWDFMSGDGLECS